MGKTVLIEANKKGELEITGVRPLDKYYLITGKDYLLLKKMEEPPPLSDLKDWRLKSRLNSKKRGLKKLTYQGLLSGQEKSSS